MVLTMGNYEVQMSRRAYSAGEIQKAYNARLAEACLAKAKHEALQRYLLGGR